MTAPKYTAIVAALLSPLLLGLSGCMLSGLAQTKTGPLVIRAEEIRLNPEQRKQTRAGMLEFRAGFALSSDTGNFGGLSGLSLSADGTRITAVSDQGDLFQARLVLDKTGTLKDLAEPRLHRLRGIKGAYISRRADKLDQDAEAIERLADGSYLISFEVRHRILRYENLAAKPVLFAAPPGINKAPRNGGLEAMTPLPDGRILVLSEKFRTVKDGSKKGDGDYIGWLLAADGKSLGQVYWPAQGIFRPTDLAALPNGDVLLLQRRYTVAGGPGMRLSHIPAANIRTGARLMDVELARMTPPLSVDNFEGLAVRPEATGGSTIYMLSDDNFNPLQRTLLLQFHLPEE
jgi:hypothetical protein